MPSAIDIPAIRLIKTTSSKQKTDQGGETLGQIHSVETCGTVDGPGMRYVAFLSGCPLHCQYCHNPDTRCRANGSARTAAELVTDVLRYRNFLRNGGLTLSGGEPMMQPNFVRAVFRLAKQSGIHTTLDTSGFLGDSADEELLSLTDLVLLDIKSGNAETYRKVTGVDLAPTLRFAKKLDALRIPVWIRFVVVPGLTDAPDNVRAVASFVATLGNVKRVELLPFHQHGRSKYEALQIPYHLAQTPAASEAVIQYARDLFAAEGVLAI